MADPDGPGAGAAEPSDERRPSLPLPEVTLRPWRFMMLQEEPRPRKRPVWHSIEARASGAIAMPEGSRWACIYNPVDIQASWEEDMKSVERWSVLRMVYCSNDGWRTYAQAVHAVYVDAHGNAESPSEQSELYLRENVGDETRKIAILLRADERKVPRPVLGPAGLKRLGKMQATDAATDTVPTDAAAKSR